MATLVRCIEGHAFDRAASETCPICGSTVWTNGPVKKPVYENRPPLDREKIMAIAVLAASVIIGLPVIFAVSLGIRQLLPEGGIKSVIHDLWPRFEPQERAYSIPTGPSGDSLFRKAACEERKLHDPNVVCIPQNPFAPKPGDTVARKPENPFVPETGNPFDPKIRFGPK